MPASPRRGARARRVGGDGGARGERSRRHLLGQPAEGSGRSPARGPRHGCARGRGAEGRDLGLARPARMIVLDTTVLVYAKGSEHPLRAPCRELIEAVAGGSIEATTSVEAIQEFVHV